MKRILQTLVTLPCMALPVLASADPEIRVERLTVTDPAESADLEGPYTSIDLLISQPGIAGLADTAQVLRARDDTGTDLLEPEGPFDRDFESEGYFMPHQRTTDTEEGWMRVPVFLPALPHPDARTIEIKMSVDILVRADGAETVLIEDVDFSDVPGWGVDLDVDGATMTCRDDRRERPEDQPLELNCFMRQGSFLEVATRDAQDTLAPTHPDANLVIEGPREAVDIEVSLPRTTVRQVPVTLAFGLGLRAAAD